MRGYIMLAEGRSGSSWLGTLTDSTGVMGRSSEWISEKIIGIQMKGRSMESFLDALFAKASTPNERFAIKVFPRHLFEFAEVYAEDFIEVCRRQHSVTLVHLERRDTLRQAVSLLRGRQTRKWSSKVTAQAKAKYDFAELAQCYFYIKESNNFWRSYFELREDVSCRSFVYEDLIDDPSPFMKAVASGLEVDFSTYSSGYEIQRDDITESWVSRFRDELRTNSPLLYYDRRKPLSRSLRNFLRLSRKQLKGYPPFSF